MAEKAFCNGKQVVWIKLVVAVWTMVWEVEKTDVADFVTHTYYR